jgi:hypothetical protein
MGASSLSNYGPNTNAGIRFLGEPDLHPPLPNLVNAQTRQPIVSRPIRERGAELLKCMQCAWTGTSDEEIGRRQQRATWLTPARLAASPHREGREPAIPITVRVVGLFPAAQCTLSQHGLKKVVDQHSSGGEDRQTNGHRPRLLFQRHCASALQIGAPLLTMVTRCCDCRCGRPDTRPRRHAFVADRPRVFPR